MKVFFSAAQAGHRPKYELFNGKLVTPFECPERVDSVISVLRLLSFGEISEAKSFGTDPLMAVHSERYINYLKTAWHQWSALGRAHDILPFVFPRHGLHLKEPDHIDGKSGFFAFDAGAPISAGTWEAVLGSANCALSGLEQLSKGEKSAFALCRPPGHHAGKEFSGGYCYVNNAAVAAQGALQDGAKRVAILDVDYHHGNGTQEIFYDRSDVCFFSIHATPRREFPYFLGYADEVGEGDGAGYNFNYPLDDFASYEVWGTALKDCLEKIGHYAPDVVIVSLGVDTFEGDPISRFRLKAVDYIKMGISIRGLGIPALFILEGGYAVESFGQNVVNVLRGFSGATLVGA